MSISDIKTTSSVKGTNGGGSSPSGDFIAEIVNLGNIADGEIVFKQTVNGTAQMKRLEAGSGIALTSKANALEIAYNGTSPTGGGTTITKTVVTGNFPNGIDNGVILTHPSVPIDDEENIYFIAKQKTYLNEYFTAEVLSQINNETYWVYDNENTSNRTWVNESANVGYFSGAKNAGVLAGCFIKINNVVYQILAIVGDGTASGSVTLTGDPQGNYAIQWVHGGNYINGLSIGSTPSGGGIVPTGYWFTVTATADDEYSEAYQLLADFIRQLGTAVYYQGTTMRVKVAISRDSGVTWEYHNGTTVATMTKAEWATKGIEFSYANNRWEASDGSAMYDGYSPPPSLWSAFDNLKGKGVRLMFGFFSNDVAGYAYVQNQEIQIYEQLNWRQLPISGMGSNTGLTDIRLSETEMFFYNGGFNAINDVEITVYTLS